MCAETACLGMRLEGPLQSWGTSSQYNRRQTDVLPSRSAVTGMLCAALGLYRGSLEESAFLQALTAVRMLTVAVPRRHAGKPLAVRRLEDYHTVQHTARADGSFKDCHITRRHYLLDAAFRVFLSGERTLLEKAGAALQDPIWGLWLGRKTCIPAAPVFAGLFADEQTAIKACIPEGLDGYLCARDAGSFSEGTDSVADVPLSFASSARAFALRRVQLIHEGKSDAS